MIIFFDTETNGLPKNWKASKNDVSNWPRVVQLAFAVYAEGGEKVSDYQTIIKPDGWVIGKDTSDVHGITTEIATERGVSALEAISNFIFAYENCHTMVAHNINFDYPVLGCELIRYKVAPKNRIEKHICTMLESVDFCQIPGQYGFKWPKLMELHQILFGEGFDGAHDAMVDVDACARCFFELKARGVIK
jgi:DNA polymerase III epsilon subunit-like protein